jgi:hypothetical protein
LGRGALTLAETVQNLDIHLGDIHGPVCLGELFVFDIEIQGWTVPELVTCGNLERYENLIHSLFLSGIQTRIVLEL